MATGAEDLRSRAADFQRAIEQRDGALAESVLDDDYALVLVHPQRATMPRERWLEVLPDYVVHGYDVREQVAEVDGEVGLVLSLAQMEATVLGEDRSGLFVLTDTWLVRDGEWRLWRRHSSPLSAGRMPGVEA